MKESVLKKQFIKKDVQRLRNIVQGKYGEKTRSSVGFSKSQEFYKEGDIWEVDGRTWTIKNGIKQNITKLDKAKKIHVVPLLCPKCKKIMKRPDKKYYIIHKFCLNCFAKFEDNLRNKDSYKDYYNKINNQIIDKRINEFKQYVQDRLSEGNESFVSEDGDVEKWIGKLDKEKVDEYVESVVEVLSSYKDQIKTQKEIQKAADN